MEIPYTVVARRDTGLWNAKIGIWLFLASEVMLFGGLFSSYVFLRMGHESHGIQWPHQALDIMPGFINTLVLIGSSVTVIMAWASLKMRKYGAYKVYMTITLACAAAFMGIKAFEYNKKFSHQAVLLNNGKIIYGHVHGEGHAGDHSQAGGHAAPAAATTPAAPADHAAPAATDSHAMPAAPAQHAHEGDHAAPATQGGTVVIDAEAHGHDPAGQVVVNKDDIRHIGPLVPRFNNYFGIYFTLTGLHALHVLGGAVVLGYFLFFGGSMYRKNPEHLANRVEVGGLFWHFVDLVWIFLFPLLYLM